MPPAVLCRGGPLAFLILAARRPIDLLVQLVATLWCIVEEFCVLPAYAGRSSGSTVPAYCSSVQCKMRAHTAIQCQAAAAVYACVIWAGAKQQLVQAPSAVLT